MVVCPIKTNINNAIIKTEIEFEQYEVKIKFLIESLMLYKDKDNGALNLE